MLRHFDGRIAAELRLWDAIDQEYLAPFAYFGVHDGLDLRSVPWRRGQGYDVAALEGVLTADHAWAHLVVEEVRRKIADPSRMRALGYCVSVGHAHFMAQRFTELGLPAVALSATSRSDERRSCVARPRRTGSFERSSPSISSTRASTSRASTRCSSFVRRTVRRSSCSNSGEGCGRRRGRAPAPSSTSLARTARSSASTGACALCSADRARTSSGRFAHDFPFLPAGCSFDLDPVAREIVLRSIREAIPTTGGSGAKSFARSVTSASASTSRAAGSNSRTSTPAATAGRRCVARSVSRPPRRDLPSTPLLRAVGRLLHVDDDERLETYPGSFAATIRQRSRA